MKVHLVNPGRLLRRHRNLSLRRQFPLFITFVVDDEDLFIKESRNPINWTSRCFKHVFIQRVEAFNLDAELSSVGVEIDLIVMIFMHASILQFSGIAR